MKTPFDAQFKDEATLLRKVKDWLEPQECTGIKLIRVCDRYAKGYSDLFICVHGWFVVAELKDDTGTATPHQKLFIKEMKAAGAVGGVCRSVKDVQDLIEEASRCVQLMTLSQTTQD